MVAKEIKSVSDRNRLSAFLFQMEIDEEEEEEEEDDDDEEEEVYFSAQDLLGMREDVAGLVRTLLKLLEKFSLRDKPQSADNCMRVSKR